MVFVVLLLLSIEQTIITWTYAIEEDYTAIQRQMELQRQRWLNREVVQYNALCSKTEWACNRPCRLQFPNATQKCQRPSEKDTCFGQPILYNYTSDYDELFPEYLQILQFFPKCWERLNPLICAVYYRPCSTRKYTEAGLGSVRKIELWQVFQYGLCSNAREECKFLLDLNLWPKALNCDDTIHLKRGESFDSALKQRRLLFNDDGQCKFRYMNSMLSPSNRCVPPLVDVKSEVQLSMVNPLIDECYLPCRSSFVHSVERLQKFRFWLLGISIVFGLCFLFFLIYMRLCFKSSCNGFLRFLLSNIFLSMSCFFGVWAFSVSNPRLIEDSAACINEISNVFVRRELRSGNFNWCELQSLVLSTSVVVAYEWLTIFFVFVCARPNIPSDDHLECDVNSNYIYLRPLLSCGVYALGLMFSLGGLWIRPIFADGLTGVCYNQLGAIDSAFFIHIPLLLACLISAAVFLLKLRNRDHPNDHAHQHDKSETLSYHHKQLSKPLVARNENFDMSTTDYRLSLLSLSSCSLDLSYFAVTMPWRVSVLISALATSIIAFSLHFIFTFDSNNEVAAVKEVISCTLELVRKQMELSNTTIVGNEANDVESTCQVAQASTIDLALLILYVLILPSVPFIVLVFGLIAGVVFKNHGIRWVNTWKKNHQLEFGRTDNMEMGMLRPINSATDSQLHTLVSCTPSQAYDGEDSMSSNVSSSRRNRSRKRKRQLSKSNRQSQLNEALLTDSENVRRLSFKKNFRERRRSINSSISSQESLRRSRSAPANVQPTSDTLNLYLMLQCFYELIVASTNPAIQMPNISTEMLRVNPHEPSKNDLLNSYTSEDKNQKEQNEESEDDSIESNDDSEDNGNDSNSFDSDESDTEEERHINEQQNRWLRSQTQHSQSPLEQSETIDLENGSEKPSRLLDITTKYVQSDENISNRFFFHFRRLFENDQVFRPLCINKRANRICNSELNTRDQNHMVTLNELFDLTAQIRDPTQVKRMNDLWKEATRLAWS
ncbi:hypothetical protein M3Y96_00223400 [Aphelenchoides besseyi]|nr:hypothetical protein M3Y96_00223400 [Aphelenchoides besseyi]